MKIEVLDQQGRVRGTVPSAKRRGLSRVTWSMRLDPPKVPPAASAAPGALFGPRVLPGSYTVRMTKDKDIYTTRLELLPDPRTTYAPDDRKAEFELATKLAAMLGDMSFAVERINALRTELDMRAAKLPPGDPLAKRLRTASATVDQVR
jgi:hypothetical protein